MTSICLSVFLHVCLACPQRHSVKKSNNNWFPKSLENCDFPQGPASTPPSASATAKPLMQQIGNPLPVAQDSSYYVASAVKALFPARKKLPKKYKVSDSTFNSEWMFK